MCKTRLKVNNPVRWTISLICILLILLAGAAATVACVHPDWASGVKKALTRQSRAVTVTTDESFPYRQSEDELTRIVSARFPMEEDYVPEDLTNLYEHKDRAFELARVSIDLRMPAYEAAQAMFTAAKEDGISDFIISSGYRTREYQQTLYDNSDTGYVNAPGESEHEYGLTFDVTTRTDRPDFDQTPQFEWLSAHCWEYGYILRYPEGKEALTGVPYESWHYRYVGKEAAKVIHDNGWCLEEYAALN